MVAVGVVEVMVHPRLRHGRSARSPYGVGVEGWWGSTQYSRRDLLIQRRLLRHSDDAFVIKRKTTKVRNARPLRGSQAHHSFLRLQLRRSGEYRCTFLVGDEKRCPAVVPRVSNKESNPLKTED